MGNLTEVGTSQSCLIAIAIWASHSLIQQFAKHRIPHVFIDAQLTAATFVHARGQVYYKLDDFE